MDHVLGAKMDEHIVAVVRLAAGSRRGLLPGGPRGRRGARRAPLHPRHQRARDDLDEPDGLADRAGRPARGAVARRGGALQHPPPRADRRRRRARPAARGPLRAGCGRAPTRLRAELRLRPAGRRVGVHGGDLQRGGCDGRGLRRGAQADYRPARGLRGAARPRAAHAARRGVRVRGALLERARAAAGRGGGRPADAPHREVLDRVAEPRRLPRPPVADLPPAKCAHAQGSDLRAHRRDARGGDHLASRDASR